MATTRNCTVCGKGTLEPGVSSCPHCGAPLAGAGSASSERTAAERFAELERHAGFAELMAWTPARAASSTGSSLLPAAAVVLLVVAVTVWVASGMESVAAGFGAAGLILGVLAVARRRGGPAPELERLPAQLDEARQAADGEGGERSLTLVLRDGRRRVVTVPGGTVIQASRGEVGVAYLQAGRLIAFRGQEPG